MKKKITVPMPKRLCAGKLTDGHGTFCLSGWLLKHTGVAPKDMVSIFRDAKHLAEFGIDRVLLREAVEENDAAKTQAERLAAFRRNCKKLGVRIVEDPKC